MKKFVHGRIGTNSTMSSFDPVKKNKLNTIKNMSKVTPRNHYAHSSSWFIFKNRYSQKCSTDLKSLFSYPLAPLSMSLTETDEILKKSTKVGVLLHKLEKDVEPVTEYLNDSAYGADRVGGSRARSQAFKVYILRICCTFV